MAEEDKETIETCAILQTSTQTLELEFATVKATRGAIQLRGLRAEVVEEHQQERGGMEGDGISGNEGKQGVQVGTREGGGLGQDG